MKAWIVKFELFGKKMKTRVHAESKQAARDYIKSRVLFHSVEEAFTDEEITGINDGLDKIISVLESNTKGKQP